jgi:NAD-dependent histone deacetylase SIR2
VLVYQLQLEVSFFLYVIASTNYITVQTFDDPKGVIRKFGGKSILSENVFKTVDATRQYLRLISTLLAEVGKATPTAFHWMLNHLARRGDNIRIYTQNIDGLENRCPWLSSQIPPGIDRETVVVPLHGSLRAIGCSLCNFTSEMQISLFRGGTLPDCPECPKRTPFQHPDRTRPNLRRKATIIGTLRPLILLYDSPPDAWNVLDFSDIQQYDEHEAPPDTVVVIGTNLQIKATQQLVYDLSAAAHKKSSNGLALWVNPKGIPRNLKSDTFDYVLNATADDFAAFLQVQE